VSNTELARKRGVSQPVLGQAVKMGRKLPAGMDSIWNDKDTYFFIYVPWASWVKEKIRHLDKS
jgi:hypothetical protein